LGGAGDIWGGVLGAVGEGVEDGVSRRGDELVYELWEDGETSVTKVAPFWRRTVGADWRGINCGMKVPIKVAIWMRMELWIISRVIAAVLRKGICLRWGVSTKTRPTQRS